MPGGLRLCRRRRRWPPPRLQSRPQPPTAPGRDQARHCAFDRRESRSNRETRRRSSTPLTLAGAALTIASLFPGWIGFLDGQKHNAAPGPGLVLWAAVAVIGVVVVAIAYGADKDGAHRASAFMGRGLDRLLDGAAAAYSRFLSEPVGVITRVVSDWIPQGDGDLARAAAASGRFALAAARTPAVPVLVVLAAGLAIAVALLSPGLFR